MRIGLGNNTFMESDENFRRGPHVCFVVSQNIGRSNWETLATPVHWSFLMICTTGTVYEGNRILGTTTDLQKGFITTSLAWFTRRLPTTAHYCYPTNAASCGLGMVGLITAVDNGASIITTQENAGGVVNHVSPHHQLQIVRNTCTVTGLVLWDIGASTNRFNYPLYWYLQAISSSGFKHVSRWYIGQHDIKSNSDVSGKVFRWYLDVCWEMVYRHTESGAPVLGNISDLNDKIIEGRRIRLMYQDVAMETDNIVVDESSGGIVITAQLLNQMQKDTPTTFDVNGLMRWVELTTNGSMSTYLYELGSSVKIAESFQRVGATWFAENRKWYLVFSTSSTGSIINGSKIALEQSIRLGTRVRCVFMLNGTTVAATADNVEIDAGGNISALMMRFLLLTTTPAEQRILLVTTKGQVKESRWVVGANITKGDFVYNVQIEWYVDQLAK